MFDRTKNEEDVMLLEEGDRLLLLFGREDVVSRNHFGVLRSVVVRATRRNETVRMREVDVSGRARLCMMSRREALHSIHSDRDNVL